MDSQNFWTFFNYLTRPSSSFVWALGLKKCVRREVFFFNYGWKFLRELLYYIERVEMLNEENPTTVHEREWLVAF